MTHYEQDLDLRAEAVELAAEAKRQMAFDEGVRMGRVLERRAFRRSIRPTLAESAVLLLAGIVTGAVLMLGFIEIYGVERWLR